MSMVYRMQLRGNMVSTIVPSSSSSPSSFSWHRDHSLFFHPHRHNHNKLSWSEELSKQGPAFLPSFNTNHICLRSSQTLRFFSSAQKSQPKLRAHQDSGLEWHVLRRWEVPWTLQEFSLTSLACAFSFVSACWLVSNVLPSLGIQLEELSSDAQEWILLVWQSFATYIVLQVLYEFTNTYQPLPQDLFNYDWREPLNPQKGWLLWAGVGLACTLIATALIVSAISFCEDSEEETPTKEADAIVSLLPPGSSYVRIACMVGSSGLLAPLFEETVFRGFFMASLTKWVPTPVAVLISAAVFAHCHLTPGVFLGLFILGTAFGISYAQTRNLLTPIAMHAFWNLGQIILHLL